MCFSRTVTGLARSSALHSWSKDRSNSLSGEFWANVSVPLTVCCPALMLSDLFALGLGIPKIWPFFWGQPHVLLVPRLCSRLAANREGWCSPPARRVKDSEGKGGGSGGMSGVGLPSSTALGSPLSQADFSPRIRHLPALPAFFWKMFPCPSVSDRDIQNLEMQPPDCLPCHTHPSQPPSRPAEPNHFLLFFFLGKYIKFFLFQLPAPATLNPKPNSFLGANQADFFVHTVTSASVFPSPELAHWLCHPIPVTAGSHPHSPRLLRASQPSARTRWSTIHPAPLCAASLCRVLMLPSHQPCPTSFQLCLSWSSPSPPLCFSWAEPPRTHSTHWIPPPPGTRHLPQLLASIAARPALPLGFPPARLSLLQLYRSAPLTDPGKTLSPTLPPPAKSASLPDPDIAYSGKIYSSCIIPDMTLLHSIPARIHARLVLAFKPIILPAPRDFSSPVSKHTGLA